MLPCHSLVAKHPKSPILVSIHEHPSSALGSSASLEIFGEEQVKRKSFEGPGVFQSPCEPIQCY